MISRIDGGVFPAGGAALYRARPAGDGRVRAVDCDQARFSARLSGLEGRVQDLTARISQEMRIRPTNGELRTLADQVRAGSYQPDAREIAARMLLLGEEG